MQIKALELRDRLTFIPALAIKMVPDDEPSRFLLARCGFTSGTQIVLMKINDQKAHCDPYDWDDRTMQTAHLHVEQHFDTLESGAVIDVRVLLGEETEPAASERIANVTK